MAQESGMRLPGTGFGGIMRYDEEYASRFMISPAVVIAFGIAVVAIVFLLKVFFPMVK